VNIRNWFSPWRVALAVIVLVVAGVVLRNRLKPPEPPAVTTAAVTRGELEVGVLATGTIEAARLVSVGAQATGELKRLYVKLGDKVRKGDLIAEIDSLTQQNSLRSATASLADVQAQRNAKLATLKQSELAVARLRALVAIDAGSRTDLESDEATLDVTRAGIASLDAQIAEARVNEDTAKVNLGYTRIVAPMDGTVVAVVTEQGQTVNAAQSAPTIIKLARLDTMTIKAQISEADVPRVKPGLPVYFTLLGDPDTRYDTTLGSVEPGPTTLDTDSTSSSSSSTTSTTTSTAAAIYYNGIFQVPNPEGKLRISMTAQSTIVLARVHDALQVPAAALGLKDKQGLYAVRVLAGPALEVRHVRIGLNNRVQAQVLEGLKAGDRVVTSEAAPAGANTGMGGGRGGPPPGM